MVCRSRAWWVRHGSTRAVRALLRWIITNSFRMASTHRHSSMEEKMGNRHCAVSRICIRQIIILILPSIDPNLPALCRTELNIKWNCCVPHRLLWAAAVARRVQLVCMESQLPNIVRQKWNYLLFRPMDCADLEKRNSCIIRFHFACNKCIVAYHQRTNKSVTLFLHRRAPSLINRSILPMNHSVCNSSSQRTRMWCRPAPIYCHVVAGRLAYVYSAHRVFSQSPSSRENMFISFVY